MPALIDTSVLVDYTRGRRTDQVAKFSHLVASGDVLIGDLVLCEFLRGLDTEQEAWRAQQAFERFPILELCGSGIAIEAARNYRLLRALGITVRKTIDLIVGTYCIRHSIPLLHNDRDYDPMEHHLGLKVF